MSSFADVKECELYLAPSLTPGLGRGVFAGSFIPSGNIVEDSVTLKIPSDNLPLWQLDNYYWGTNDHDTLSVEFGAGSFFNHRNPSNVWQGYGAPMPQSVNQNLAHTTYKTAPVFAGCDILPGEELFNSYGNGNKWLEKRGIIGKEVTNSSVRTIKDLKEIGHCITQVKVRKSTLPFAGRGLFASRNFVKGEIVSISPLLLLPKDEVAEVGTYSDSVLQNYCIASPDSGFVLFPLGLGSLANHAMELANMELEIFWWESTHPTDDVDKMRIQMSTLAELSQEKFAQLDIAYRATRDIHEGEELTYNYGEGWVNSWASHLAEVNDWLVETAVTVIKVGGEVQEDFVGRPRFLSYIEAPKNLYLHHWKDKMIGLEDMKAESGSNEGEFSAAVPFKHGHGGWYLPKNNCFHYFWCKISSYGVAAWK